MARVPHRTFYDVLGINQDANYDAIKLAYKKMSRRCHPDKNPGNGHAVAWQQEVSSQPSSTADTMLMELFDSQVNKAYETLRDAASRVAYDARLPPHRRVLNPFTPQYTGHGFDGAWGAPAPAHWQPAGYYHSGQRPATNDYWGGTQAQAGFDRAWGRPSSVPWQPGGYYHSGQRPTTNDYWGGTQAQAGFDGAWGMHSSVPPQPAEYYPPEQRTTTDKYWSGTRPWYERSTCDSKYPQEQQERERDQGWDSNNWHESQPSERGSFPWTENQELWRQADEERIKAEKEQEERADAERRRRRKKKRAKRDEEQKRINDARIPAQQKKLSGKIIALDEEIARLSRRSVPARQTEDGCRTDGEGTDTVDHFAIKLNRRRRLLGETLNIHHRLCRAQRSNSQADEADDAERELAKAREDTALRLADEFAREEEEERSSLASFHEEHLRMQQRRLESHQEEKREFQDEYDWNDAASGNPKPNESRVSVEYSNVEDTWPEERNVCGLSSKLQEQPDIGANPVPMQLRSRRICEWLDQLVDEEEENEVSRGDTVKNTKHPDSPMQPSQAPRNPVDHNSETPFSNQNPCSPPSQVCQGVYNESEPEPLIPDLSPRSSSSQASSGFANEGPDPQILPPNRSPSFPFGFPSAIHSKPGPHSEALKLDNEIFISGYLQTVHKPHLEVHGEFWDFGADEVSCDFCHLLSPVLQCPKCNLRACSECKTNRGERSCDNMWEWR